MASDTSRNVGLAFGVFELHPSLHHRPYCFVGDFTTTLIGMQITGTCVYPDEDSSQTGGFQVAFNIGGLEPPSLPKVYGLFCGRGGHSCNLLRVDGVTDHPLFSTVEVLLLVEPIPR